MEPWVSIIHSARCFLSVHIPYPTGQWNSREERNQDPQHRGRSVGRHQEEEVRELRRGEECQDQDGDWGQRQQESLKNSPV